MRGDRSGIIGVLDRLSRSHRVTRSKGAAGDVDRDNVGPVRAGLDDSTMVKLCERLIAGARLRLWPDEIRRCAFFTASSNVCPWLTEPIFLILFLEGIFLEDRCLEEKRYFEIER